MSGIGRIASALWPTPSGLEVDEPEAMTLAVAPPYGRVFRALDALLGPGTVLYWEGKAGPIMAAWLDRMSAEPRPAFALGVVPVPDFYHIPLDAEVLEGLAQRVELPNAIDGRVRLHAYLNQRIVWQWRPAFGPTPMLISRRLPDYRTGEFLRALSD